MDEFDDQEPKSLHVLLRGRHVHYRRGWKSLLNYLEAVEMTRGVRFIVRGRGKRYQTYRVSMAHIREFTPELLPPAKRPARASASLELRAAQEFLESLQERQRDVAREVVDEEVKPLFRALKLRMDKFERMELEDEIR